MENNEELIREKTDLIDYKKIIQKYPWVIERDRYCILNPDTDGILCGLFMNRFLNWKIVGYYDDKELAIRRGIKPSECVFLDVEIYRKEFKSIGQHMVLYNKREDKKPKNWNNFSNCINPNILRDFDVVTNFELKYPLATIHLLLCIIASIQKIVIPKSAITGLLYVDGTFKNLLNYPENCISWLRFLNAKDKNSPIYPLLLIFADQTISSMMHELENIFVKFREIANAKKGGDKIKLSDIEDGSLPSQAITLIAFLSTLTQWNFDNDDWAIKDLDKMNFDKRIIPIKKSSTKKLNYKNYTSILMKNPISFAITKKGQMEYTLESSQNYFKVKRN